MKISIVIPCYNEEEGLRHLADNLFPVLDQLSKDYDWELIFVDDGSKDNTYQLLQEIFVTKFSAPHPAQHLPPHPAQIIRHEKNMNLGAALRTGFAAAQGDIIVTMDSDCTYEPKGIFDLLKLMDEETAIVTASPYHPLGGVNNVPKYRLALSKAVTAIYRLLTGSKIYTFTALFRAQRKDVVKNIPFRSNDFLSTAEFLIFAMMKGYQVKEYPTVLNVRVFGTSKMKLLRVIKSHTAFALRVAKHRLKGDFSGKK